MPILPACVPGTTATGRPCAANPDCTANHNDPICLGGGQFPGSYCSEFCDLSSPVCSAGNVCYGGLGVSKNGVCLHSCTSDADCRTADVYTCQDPGLSTKVCR